MIIPSVPAQSDLDDLTGILQGSGLNAWDFGRAAIILGVSIVAARLGQFVIPRILARRRTDTILVDLARRVVSYTFVLFGSIYALETLGVAIGPLLGALGIVGFALAFALRDIVENFLAGFILQVGRPFKANDEIATGEFEGIVTAVEARTITIRTPDGETVRVPSAEVIKAPIINHTEIGYRRSTVEVGVAYGTDLGRACAIAVAAVGDVESVRDQPEPEALLFQFGDSGIDLAVRFWHGATITQKWQAMNDVVLAVDAAFEANDVTIPFPQRTVHLPAPHTEVRR